MVRQNSPSVINRHLAEFSRRWQTYERFSQYVCELVGAHCGKEYIHTTQHRAKTLDSFERKCLKVKDDGTPRYRKPLDEVTDLAGVRIIVFVRDSVDIVCKSIASVLDVMEMEDVGERVYNQGKFGYQSKHLLIKLGKDRQNLIENSEFQGLVCEIQVRTLLQHAWAEMEHDIQYKSDQEIPLDLKKRFSALAGLLEIADREFENIQKDSDNLRSTVKNELINELTRQGLSEITDSEADGKPSENQSVAARELVNLGRYADAIDIYSRKIENEPASYTLFLGRAKARFINGDVKGAIADLDEVDRLRGDTSATERLRSIIERGDDPGIVLSGGGSESKYTDGITAALSALASGDGVKAFIEYTTLEAEGFNRAFSLFGKAMSCLLEKDTAGAKNYLSHLEIRQSTPMSVNICVLNAIMAIIDNEDFEGHRHYLTACLKATPNYSFDLSPLKSLFVGISKKSWPEVSLIFEVGSQVGREN